jgi:hypothetical protein
MDHKNVRVHETFDFKFEGACSSLEDRVGILEDLSRKQLQTETIMYLTII